MDSLLGAGTLLAGDRTEYRLAEKIAEGGEGIVYRVEGRGDLVAKIYREFDFTREDKLRRMIEQRSKKLARVSAWPLGLLQAPDAKTVGFVMQRLESWQPLHAVYQVKNRLDHHPERTWEFLVRTARNLCVCVHDVHEAGFVIGDLNESNVLVDDRAMVKIIDCDSFQAEVNGRLYPCKVGKAELLAPELQGMSLKGVRRHENQDRFALAVLLFQTLVFGRHPFAGRPTDESERPLEECIRDHHYAYTTQRKVPLLPPRHLELDFLPSDVRELFERAFGPEHEHRPSAAEWFSTLKKLEGELLVCRENPRHRYGKENSLCPWCRIEEKGNITLFKPSLELADIAVESDHLWQPIESLRSLLPSVSTYERPSYRNLPPAELSKFEKFFGRSQNKSPFWFWFVFFPMINGNILNNLRFAFMLMVLPLLSPYVFLSAKTAWMRRKLQKADGMLQRLWLKHESEATARVIQNRFEMLEDIHRKLSNFDEYVADARQKLLEKKYQPQLESFLRKYSLLGADIGPYGREKLSSLYDAGYQTAADLSSDRLNFTGNSASEIRQALLAWRRSLEIQFWSTSINSLTLSEERQLTNSMRKQATEMRRVLQQAPEKLEQLSQQVEIRHRELLAEAAPYEAVIYKFGPRVLAFEQAATEDTRRKS